MTTEKGIQNLISGFVKSSARFGGRPALVVDGREFTYAELLREVGSLAAAIQAYEQDTFPLAALLAYRSSTAYSGVLGILASGKGYVPLNPKFPIERTRSMLLLSGCTTLIAGKEGLSQIPALLSGVNRHLTIILPNASDHLNLRADFPQHRFVFSDEVARVDDFSYKVETLPHAIAYLLFTSGSTGVPKGVPIHHENVRPYVEYTCDRYQVTHEDRFSQEFDQTFDLSVHDMFVCWERGACLFVVPEKAVMAPAKFIRENELTMWFSVPSVAGLLMRMRLLSANSFPSLRYSLFCGEPLSAAYASAWQEAAPNSIVENLYGPTEATIAISNYRWDQKRSLGECVNGIVPIGKPFAGQEACVIGEDRWAVSAGEAGELCLSGSQVTTGYWNNLLKTEEQFVHLPGTGETSWYRTGDLVRRDQNDCLIYLGRSDHQIKIRGYRVELQEIEAVLRKMCGTEQVVSLAWPIRNGSADGVVAFVAGMKDFDCDRILRSCSELLPEFMVPRKIHLLEQLPLNVNGKIDRPKLAKSLEGMPS